MSALWAANWWLDWSLWLLAALFAVAAVGLALRWTWTEGLTYGLMIILVGSCLVLLHDLLEWRQTTNLPAFRTFLIALGILLAVIAIAIWVADTVRRRFEPPAPTSTGAPEA